VCCAGDMMLRRGAACRHASPQATTGHMLISAAKSSSSSACFFFEINSSACYSLDMEVIVQRVPVQCTHRGRLAVGDWACAAPPVSSRDGDTQLGSATMSGSWPLLFLTGTLLVSSILHLQRRTRSTNFPRSAPLRLRPSTTTGMRRIRPG